MKAKKLIEVALPIKEISAESVRDKSIRHGHISTLHLWWARRPLPVCRAVVFASLVPDPLDENCPQAFRDAVKALLDGDSFSHLLYKPYEDIPYTAIYDPMEDNLRHRLMMYIGKFSDDCAKNMLKGESTSPKDQLSEGSLIKWENKDNPKILRIARELIYVAYNAEKNPLASYATLHQAFDEAFDAIKDAEDALYSIPNRHKETEQVKQAETRLQQAIENFQSQMPSVLDPFAGGGAIPLEAARLGCRSYGNDINPVAHIIEKGSAEFPQKFGKPIRYSYDEFIKLYGEDGLKLLKEKGIYYSSNQPIEISNRLAFDVEFYAKKIINNLSSEENLLYPKFKGKTPNVLYWAKAVRCSNPSCNAKVPLLRQFYISKRRNAAKKDWVYLSPIIENNSISFEIKRGVSMTNEWSKRGNLICPCCGSITDVSKVKEQFINKTYETILLAIISEDNGNRSYDIPSKEYSEIIKTIFPENRPNNPMPIKYTQAMPCCTWGISKWGDLFSNRQIYLINKFEEEFNLLKGQFDEDGVIKSYNKVILTYLSILLDRFIARYTEFGVWHVLQETVEHPFGRQAIPMKLDYPELNPFSSLSASFYGQLVAIINYISEENDSFPSTFANASSGERNQFAEKELTAVVTDPPYYDAIAYADLSDFFYVWLSRNIGDLYSLNFATPLTPKSDECTALKHYHNNDIAQANSHFESKLTQIFDAIERQTSDVVSIMFAHQSTEAWTTLCNSILGARMNITGSWPFDTEVSNALKTDKAFLESSVTVACRPSERGGFADFRDVKRDIENKVAFEIEKLYELGYRGADLLTACFGQAVSEFGKYESVEKSNGDEVTVADLLEMARQTAFDTLLKGVQGDELTRFYIGWLQMNGAGETDFDDATKFTRVGVNVEIREVLQEGLLVQNKNKLKIAMADEHIGKSQIQGTLPSHSLIDQAHRMILTYKDGDRRHLLHLVATLAPEATSPLWRLLATLKELLPANDDLKQVQGLIINAESLRQDCQKTTAPAQGTLDF